MKPYKNLFLKTKGAPKLEDKKRYREKLAFIDGDDPLCNSQNSLKSGWITWTSGQPLAIYTQDCIFCLREALKVTRACAAMVDSLLAGLDKCLQDCTQ